jgi:hypothetical protein
MNATIVNKGNPLYAASHFTLVRIPGTRVTILCIFYRREAAFHSKGVAETWLVHCASGAHRACFRWRGCAHGSPAQRAGSRGPGGTNFGSPTKSFFMPKSHHQIFIPLQLRPTINYFELSFDVRIFVKKVT